MWGTTVLPLVLAPSHFPFTKTFLLLISTWVAQAEWGEGEIFLGNSPSCTISKKGFPTQPDSTKEIHVVMWSTLLDSKVAGSKDFPTSEPTGKPEKQSTWQVGKPDNPNTRPSGISPLSIQQGNPRGKNVA